MNKHRILITGVNGFVGKHLARALYAQDISVVGAATSKADLEIADLLDDFIACDLTSQDSVAKIDFGAVTAVVHLAALSSQGMSFSQPQKFIASNSAMVINLFEAALAQKLNTYPRFIMVSSGAVYKSDQPMPLTEAGQTTHDSPYAISKLLGEMLGDYYHKRGISSIVVRPFNHTGPGQGPGFLLPDLVKQLYKLGEGDALKVGNLKTRRDYTDVRDVVQAYISLATAAEVKNRLYNVCSGKSLSGEEILIMVAQALQKPAPHTETDPARIRPNDPHEIFGSTARLKTDAAWEPTIKFEQTVGDYVAWFKKNPF